MKGFTARARRVVGLLFLAAVSQGSSSCATLGWGTPSVSDHELEVWAEYLVPSGDEAAWLELPWIPTLAEGVRFASDRGRPLLVWVMNGHPLGCT